jgi:hypothetical protein
VLWIWSDAYFKNIIKIKIINFNNIFKNTYVVSDVFIPLRAVATDDGHIVAKTSLALSRAL